MNFVYLTLYSRQIKEFIIYFPISIIRLDTVLIKLKWVVLCNITIILMNEKICVHYSLSIPIWHSFTTYDMHIPDN